jgi:COP9 signalosome complex subunit 7
LLSLLPLSHEHASLTYPALMRALDLPTTRALEELITTAIYAGLISATLDSAHALVNVTSISPLRDLAPGSLPAMQSTLSTWSLRCDTALLDLEAQVFEVRRAAVMREKMRRKKERVLEVMVHQNNSTDEKGPQKRSVADEDAMDIDQDGGSARVTRGAKRGAPGFGSFGGVGKRLG